MADRTTDRTADRTTELMENAVTEHVSKEDLASILGRAPGRSWAAVHEAAHAFDDDGGATGIEKPALDDIIAVAAQMERAGEPFPADDEALYLVMNRAAAQVPHR